MYVVVSVDCVMCAEGVVEVWLTSEDLGAYGHDIGVTLPQLLWQLVPTVPEGCMLRLGMTNPPYIMDHLEVRGQGDLSSPYYPSLPPSISLSTLRRWRPSSPTLASTPSSMFQSSVAVTASWRR